MKRLFWLLAAALLPLLLGFAYLRWHASSSIAITVHESTDVLQVRATYPADQSWRVARYVNASLQPDHLFGATEKRDEVLVLTDHTRVQVKAAPGTLYLTLINKCQTPPATLTRFRQLGRGLGPLLTVAHDR